MPFYRVPRFHVQVGIAPSASTGLSIYRVDSSGMHTIPSVSSPPLEVFALFRISSGAAGPTLTPEIQLSDVMG